MKEIDLEIENILTNLILAIIESGYYYNKENRLVRTKTKEQIIDEINNNISDFCAKRNIEEKDARAVLSNAIKQLNELKYNETERNMAIDLLKIKDYDDEREI